MRLLFKNIIILFITLSNALFAQSLHGTIPSLSNQWLKFGTFEGMQSKTLDSALVNEKGVFTFNFTTQKHAVGYLISAENKPYFLILDKSEQIELSGEDLSIPEKVKVNSGKQNQVFAQYASEHPKREQTLGAWRYLNQIYTSDPLFSKDTKAKKFIDEQYGLIKKQDQDFLNQLDPKSYVAWYLPVRRLVSDVSIVAQYRTEEIPATIQAFRKLDYTDERLYRSGLLKDAIGFSLK